ncbi:hypothetical protein N6H14_31375 [Paenibacillus sp. CC-CFT747]|nr:hypothetical protein N6H14_31375 [Paenibacillus sp. CC-CFT747]
MTVLVIVFLNRHYGKNTVVPEELGLLAVEAISDTTLGTGCQNIDLVLDRSVIAVQVDDVYRFSHELIQC